MANYNFYEDEQRVRSYDYIPDTRSTEQRLGDWLQRPNNHVKVLIGYSIAVFVLAPLWHLITFIALMHHFVYFYTPKPAPLRYPKDLGGIDPIDNQSADGTYFLGWERSRYPWKRGRELWLSQGDNGVHKLLMGTTGSGKTQYLLSVEVWNTLCSSSGYLFADGKADNELPIKNWALLKAQGLEDQALVINYLLGGYDPFVESKNKLERKTNKANFFGDAPMDFLSELLTSMLPKAEGDAAAWQQKAINMMKAAVRIACFFRNQELIELSVGTLREFMSLQLLIKIVRDAQNNPGKYPANAISALKSYLQTGISWNPNGTKPEDRWKGSPLDESLPFKEKISDQTQTQHGYLTNQFLAPLSMLADTYGHIFKSPYPEVDMADVMLRRRALVVCIPTLEKSPQEAANLGKLLVGAMKLMMGQNLGHRLEGSYQQIIKNKATNSKTRFSVTLDEVGYYFSPGLDVIFAQARSLQQSCTLAGQDFFAMKKEGKDEVYSTIANTKIKICLALEDPTETFEIFQKAAGKMPVYRSSGSESSGSSALGSSWRQTGNTQVELIDKITFEEIKSMQQGDGVIIFQDKVVRFKSFYVFKDIDPDIRAHYKINRFLQIRTPKFAELIPYLIPESKATNLNMRVGRVQNIKNMLNDITVPRYELEKTSDTHILFGVGDHVATLNEMLVDHTYYGIVPFVGICRALGLTSLFKSDKTGETSSTSSNSSLDFELERPVGFEEPDSYASTLDELLATYSDNKEPFEQKKTAQPAVTKTLVGNESHVIEPPVRVSSWILGQEDAEAGVVNKEGHEFGAYRELSEEIEGIIKGSATPTEKTSQTIDALQGFVESVENDPIDQAFESALSEFKDNDEYDGFGTSMVAESESLSTNDTDTIESVGSVIDSIPVIELNEQALNRISAIENQLMETPAQGQANTQKIQSFVEQTTIRLNREHNDKMISNSIEAKTNEQIDVDELVESLFGDLSGRGEQSE